MKQTNLILVTTIILSCFFTIANSQTINYKIVEDNPYKNNLEISVLPFYTDWAVKNNLSLGYGLHASLTIKKKATFSFYMERPYASGMDWGYHFATVGIFSSPTVNVVNKFLHLEIGGTYHLFERTKSKQRKVVLSSRSSGNYTYTKSIMVPATVRKVFGIRGGLYNYHTAITARQNGTVGGDLGIGAKGVVSTDGTRFGGAANLNPNSASTDPFYNTESATNMKVLGVYGGISSTSYHRIIVDADGYGNKGGERVLNFYADAMIAPVRIDDFVTASGKKYDVSGTGAQGFKTRPFGVRVGYEYTMTKKHLGYFGKTEIGIKPGLAVSKFYVSLAFGITFRGRIKKLAVDPL